ncbi:MAG TPA: nucleotide sugar dehydrogenase [Gemmataceae bacterium]|jgi:UDP-N-acetyl-D-mannosaminuronic acid dehydrogenase
MPTAKSFPRDVAVIGGCGHVGLPLALTFADTGLRTVIYDVNTRAVEQVRAGRMPFHEDGADELLKAVLANGKLDVRSDPGLLSECRFLVLIIGTPVDEHLNPTFTAMHRVLDRCAEHLRDGQVMILRSTIYPGISSHVQGYLRDRGFDIPVAFCPERVAQGASLKEFRSLPQLISAFDRDTLAAVRDLFGRFVPETVEMAPMEAELCKLLTNAWRYIQFATVNQFYMIASQHGLDFDRILHGCRHNYPRMAGMPGPGLAAGPCLVKDTMQLAAFSQNSFVLGHAAMLINEGLPAHLIQLARNQTPLIDKTAGILGLTFKAESDDIRDSLSYKLRKLLTLECRRVLAHDPFVDGPDVAPLDDVLAQSDVLFVATPHKAYRDLAIPPGRVVVDVWNVVKKAPNPSSK